MDSQARPVKKIQFSKYAFKSLFQLGIEPLTLKNTLCKFGLWTGHYRE